MSVENENRDEELLDKLETFFEADINRYLSEHGGGAEVVDVEGNELIVRLYGDCRHCMDDNVEDIILPKVRAVFPFIEKVSVTDDVSDDVYEMAISMLSAYN